MALLEKINTLVQFVGINKKTTPRETTVRENFQLVFTANAIRKIAKILLRYPVTGQYILPAGVGLEQDPNADVVEGRFLVVPAAALEPVVQFFGELSESIPSQMIAIVENGTGNQCLTAADLACGLAKIYNATLTHGLCAYQKKHPDGFYAITLQQSTKRSIFAFPTEVGDTVIPSITPLPRYAVKSLEYFGDIKPLLSDNDGLEIALGVNGVAGQLGFEDLLFPYPNKDLCTCVVTVFPRSSR